MAKNYSIGEAVNILVDNKDKEAIMDIGRRYPMLAIMITRVASKSGSDFAEFMSYFPEHISANKINKAIKGSGDEVDEDVNTSDEADDISEGAALKKKKEKVERTKKRGKKAEPELEEEMNEPVDEDDEEDSKYDGVSAQDLFKECKKRKIKAEAKKPAKYYVELLEKADKEAKSTDDEEEDDEWDI